MEWLHSTERFNTLCITLIFRQVPNAETPESLQADKHYSPVATISPACCQDTGHSRYSRVATAVHTQTPASIALYSASNQLGEVLQQLAGKLQIPLVDTVDASYDFLLIVKPWPTEPGYLCQLQQTGTRAPGPVFVDFTAGKSAHRRQYGGGRKQALARAIGMRAGHNPNVLDVTAGLGRDAYVLASLGCHVTLLERRPVIFELLNNGIARARQDPQTADIANSMELIYADANEYLANLPVDSAFDVIYLDPMYPERGKSALVKKEMRYFHAIAGKDEDADTLLLLALQCAPRRVVVKRPAPASALAEKKPDAIVSSKNTRYDIYLHH
jgi:16S rRNA (guanine1516-N2)-methyltransferase